MSRYKVPQDVEADDKLIGPFSFRQFIYLMVAGMAVALAVFLWPIFPGLVIIPAPVIIFFLALALPLRKDQPMEIYLAAVLSFHLKPRLRIWKQDGIEQLIEISAPKVVEPDRVKNISQDEAIRRLSYLSDVVDTEGWAIKHAISPNESFHQDYIIETRGTEDMFENSRISNNIDDLLTSHSNKRKQEIMRNMNTARDLAEMTNYSTSQIQNQVYADQDPQNFLNQAAEIAASNHWQPVQTPPSAQPQNQQNYLPNQEEPKLHFNPYPENIHQTVIQPINQNSTNQIPPAANQPTQTEPSAEILKLVSEGKDLSVETLARQANKIREREISANKQREGNLDEEVIISLR